MCGDDDGDDNYMLLLMVVVVLSLSTVWCAHIPVHIYLS